MLLVQENKLVRFFTFFFAPMAMIMTVLGTGGPANSQESGAPTAIVEEIEAADTEIQFMDLLLPGQVIKLGRNGKVTLSYFDSCTNEEIVGGSVTVGKEKSIVVGSKVTVKKSDDCHKGDFVLKTASAQSAAAVVFRGRKPNAEKKVKAKSSPPPKRVLMSTHPVILFLGKSPKTVQLGDIFGLDVTKLPAENARIDFYERGITLENDKTYVVEMDDEKVYLQIAADAVAGQGPLLRRAVILDLR